MWYYYHKLFAISKITFGVLTLKKKGVQKENSLLYKSLASMRSKKKIGSKCINIGMNKDQSWILKEFVFIPKKDPS
jgi:hypothetical protein